MDEFNPYRKWLGIPLKHQPPNHYRLLGLEAFESDLDTIEHAADRQMAHVRTFQTGKFADASQNLLNELSSAKICLLNADKKSTYDAELKLQLRPAMPVAKAPPPKIASERALPQAKQVTAAPVVATPIHNVQPKPNARKQTGSLPLPLPLILLIAGSGLGALLLMTIVGVWFLSADEDSPTPVSPGTEVVVADPVDETIRPKKDIEKEEADPFAIPKVKPTDTEENPFVPTVKPPQQPQTSGPKFRVVTPCNIGTVTRGKEAFRGSDLKMSIVGHQLMGKKFTLLDHSSRVIRFHCNTNDSLYVVFPDQQYRDFDSAWNARRTNIQYVLTAPRKGPQRCAVYEFSPRAGLNVQLVTQSKSPPILIADDFETVQQLASIEPTPPPRIDPTPRPVDPDPRPVDPVVEVTPSAPPKRIAIPTEEQRKEVAATITDIFKPRLAKTPEDIKRISGSLIEQGKATDTTNEQYVMLCEGAKLAALTGDLQTAVGVAAFIEDKYDTDAGQLRVAILREMLKAKLVPAAKKMVYQQAISVIDQIMDADYFDEAGAILSAMTSGANRLGDRTLMMALAERRKTATNLGRQFRLVKDAKTKLKANPDDTAANLMVGRFLCLSKEEWDDGLPLLAKGDDEPLKKLVSQELKKSKSSTEMMALANGWFAEGKDSSGPQQIGMYLRAKQWYEKAKPTGLSLSLAKQNTATIDKVLKGRKPKTSGPRLIYPVKATITAASGYSSAYIYINGQYALSPSSSVYRHQHEFKKGDVICVRINRRYEVGGFAAVIQFENSPFSIATGAGSGWQSYQPASTSSWYDPRRAMNFQNVRVVNSPAANTVTEATQKECKAIWGAYDTGAGERYGYSYVFYVFK